MTHIKKSDTAKQVTFQAYFKAKYGITLDNNKRESLFCDPTRSDTKPSVSINLQKQTYYDHAGGAGGSIIDWCISKEGKTFAEAINYLTNGSFSFSRPTSFFPSEPAEPTPIITAVVPIWNYALKNYLEQERRIPKKVYTKYLKEIRYTDKGKKYFAIGFKSDAGGWELRNKHFKGCIGKKDISHIKNGSKHIVLFEGMMDFLSYIAMYPMLADDSDYIILNSVSLRKKSLPLLKGYQSIDCYYDNDKAGHDASMEALEAWEMQGKDRAEFGFHAPFIKGKDLNEQWKKECQRNRKTGI